ncbi:MAG: hypothetical protein ACPGVB_09335 [Chitinophagales bacterium]
MKPSLQICILLFLTFITFNVSAQDEYIYGKVADKDDKPMANVKVENRYEGNFTFTDIEGNYRLYLKAKRMSVVEFSIEGMETQIEEFYLREGDKREIDVFFWDSHGNKIYGCPRGQIPQLNSKSKPLMIQKIPVKQVELLQEQK